MKINLFFDVHFLLVLFLNGGMPFFLMLLHLIIVSSSFEILCNYSFPKYSDGTFINGGSMSFSESDTWIYCCQYNEGSLYYEFDSLN